MENLVNENTYIIIKKGEKTEIVDNKQVINIDISFNKYINEICNYYGSSFRGRKEATQYLTGFKSKVPIILSESKKIAIFPLFSMRCDNNIWIVYNNVLSFKQVRQYVEVTFRNDEKIILLVSYNVFKNQYLKTSHLLTVLTMR